MRRKKLNLKQLYSEVLNLNNYKPSDEVNHIFSELVSNVVADNIEININKKEIANLQNICSLAEYELEKHWSNYISESQDPKKSLLQFLYYENYKKLTLLEWSVFQSCVYHKQHNNVLFIGGGPLPMTAIMLAQDHNVKSTILDIDHTAVTLSRNLLHHLELEEKIKVIESSGENFKDYKDFNVIYLAALAGSNSSEKKRIFDQIKLLSNPSTHIIARSSYGKRKLLYKPVSSTVFKQFQKIIEVHPHNDIVNSFFLLKNFNIPIKHSLSNHG